MSTEAGELASVLAGALIRCDLMGLPFNGHHTPRPELIRIDPREAHEAFRANLDDHDAALLRRELALDAAGPPKP